MMMMMMMMMIPMDLTLVGIVTDVKDVHDSKALVPNDKGRVSINTVCDKD